MNGNAKEEKGMIERKKTRESTAYSEERHLRAAAQKGVEFGIL